MKQPIQYNLSFIKLLLLTGSIGVLSGVVIFWLLYGYISPLLISGADVVITRSKKINSVLSPNKIMEDKRQSIVSIVKYLPRTGFLYLSSDILGKAVAITADGWFVTGGVAELKDKNKLSGIRILSDDGGVYIIESALSDPATGLVFFRIKGNNFVPVQFVATDELDSRQELVSLCAKSSQITHFGSLGYTRGVVVADFLHHSDKISKSVLIDTRSTKFDNGCSLVDKDGQVVALYSTSDEGGRWVPSQYFSNVVSDVLKFQSITRSVFGVVFVDLLQATFKDVTLGQSQLSGALIFNNGRRSVLRNSPAQKAGLRDKDIILSLNGEKLGNNKNLSELIQDYRPGTIITVDVLRKGKELQLEVELGSTE